MIKNIERTKDGMDSLIDRTRDAVLGATESAEIGVKSAAERVKEGAGVAGEYVRNGAKTASKGAHRRLDDTAKAIDRGFTQARSDLSRAAAAATDYIHENPGKSLMLVASAGFVLGMSMRRRPRSV
ncbi:MAG TPA: hypothetical protein VMS86_14615 [Thermoanaerobaculia bacterium]|nr:hypothetical protein [Thermoanaerobaculia bacterium]